MHEDWVMSECLNHKTILYRNDVLIKPWAKC
jgi:hypothetical protein